MPLLEPAQLTALAVAPGDVATLVEGQPFPALYRCAMLPQLRQAVEAGASVRSTQTQSLPAPALSTAMNAGTPLVVVNTPEDLAAAERLLSRR
jgi:molybdopterin-guanine dinucleotide biosynthesis protein A